MSEGRRRRWPWVLLAVPIVVVLAAWVVANAFAADWIATHGSSKDAVVPTPTGAVDVAYSGALHAWFAAPTSGKPTVVIVHGYQANRADRSGVASSLRAQGYGTLQIDLSSDAPHKKYGGGEREAQEVAAAVAYARAQTADGRVALLGFSAGGSAAVLAATEGAPVVAVVADSSPVGFIRLATDRVSVPRWLFLMTPRFYPHYSGGGHLKDLADEVGKRRPYTVPTLVIQGTADKTVDPSNGPALAKVTHGQLWLVRDSGHTAASLQQPDEYLRRIVALFG